MTSDQRDADGPDQSAPTVTGEQATGEGTGTGGIVGAARSHVRGDQHLREATLEERAVYRGRYLTFRVDRVRDASGREHEREVVVHPGAVAIVPLDGDDVLMVRQWRHATGGALLEIPAGTLETLPDGTIEAPEVCAPRELGEETGMIAERIRYLGSFWTAPGFTDEYMHLFLAQDLEPLPGYAGPAPDERLDLVRVPLREALARADRGEIQDAKSLVGLFSVARMAERGEL